MTKGILCHFGLMIDCTGNSTQIDFISGGNTNAISPFGRNDENFRTNRFA